MNNDGRPKLTAKQLRFVAAYLETGNGTLAAKIAGYKGDDNQVGVQASVNLRNPKIQQLIEDSLFVPALKAVRDALGATKTRHFLSKDGVVISSTPEPDYEVRLHAADRVLKVRSKARGDGPEQLHDEADDDTPMEVEELDPKDQELLRHACAIEAELTVLEAFADPIEPRPINSSGAPSEQAAGNAGEHAAMPTEDPVGQGPVGQTNAMRADLTKLEAFADPIEPRPINPSGAASEQAGGDAGEHAALPTEDLVGQRLVGQTNAMRVELTDASDDGGGAGQAIRDQLEQPGNVPEVAPESGHGAEVANHPPEP